jgi:mannitol operon transcriptional antiterminator
VLPLDSRQSRIASALLETDASSVEQLATAVQLSPRVVRYNLPSVEAYLSRHGIQVRRQRGVGIRVVAKQGQRSSARRELQAVRGPSVLAVEDRLASVLLEMLEVAPQPVKSEELEARLGVSRPTVRRDVRAAEGWLEQHRLHLRRLPGVGLAVRGSELEVRAGILALVSEHVPANILASVAADAEPRPGGLPSGLSQLLERLKLPVVRRTLASELRDLEDGDPSMVTAMVSIGIGIDRSRRGRPARLGRGRLRSLLDHPVSEAARRITAALTEELGAPRSAAEDAAITESLLGLVELTNPSTAPEDHLVAWVDQVVARAAEQLHPALAGDTQLRASLLEHVRRLQVRLRYGLPFSNPLQDEVRRRYPDVYRAAEQILQRQEPIGGLAVPGEEVGFLSMYLAGALERHRLQPKVRVTVVCPAGMATVWILVSRLMAAFPQAEIAQVVSKTAFDEEVDRPTTDVMVSTVPLDNVAGDVPVVVVSPLLSERDIRHLTRYLGLPAQ